jgi:hypothetical protein
MSSVVALGARCGLEFESPKELRIRIVEFARLDDGTEVALQSERGLAIAAPTSARLADIVTSQCLEEGVRTAVLGDDAEMTGESHPWSRLVRLLHAQGIRCSIRDLQALPYEVRLGADLSAYVSD